MAEISTGQKGLYPLNPRAAGYVNICAQGCWHPKPQAGLSVPGGGLDRGPSEDRRGLGRSKRGGPMTTAPEVRTVDKWTARKIAVDLELTDEEEAMLTARAAQQGLTLEEYIRTLLSCPP